MDPRRQRIDALQAAIINVLVSGSWKEIENTFRHVDLAWREDLEPGWGKPAYVERVLDEMTDEALISLAKRIIERIEPDAAIRTVEDGLWWIEDGITQKLSEITRGEIADALDGRILSPVEDFDTLVQRLSGGMAAKAARNVHFFYNEEGRLCRRDEEWFSPNVLDHELSSHREALGKAGFFAWPDRRVLRFLEALVHPRTRTGAEQQEWVKLLNRYLMVDGFQLEESDQISGHPTFRALPTSRGFPRRPKNLIFASHVQGFKPILGLSDAIDNDLVALQNEDTCLLYDEPIPDEGLTWDHLAKWWAARNNLDDWDMARKSLGERLRKALSSEAERKLFTEYFRQLRARLGSALPALLPQVYVHYDPRNKAQRGQRPGFLIQRMDFLLLLPGRIRVVIEVDGKQHYTEKRHLTKYDIVDSNKSRRESAIGVVAMLPSPRVYADTVRGDRELRLQGYDVFRFGGHELTGPDAEATVGEFFEDLFRCRGLGIEG